MDRVAHYVVSTHWDREWYEPLQGFRMRLVSMLDETLETLRRDPAFRVFTMDGQTIPIEDYLEIRPERAEEIKSLAKAGRLKLGPWYVLPDEWLVSGESIVRNLQLGLQLAKDYGGGGPSSRVGFACDLFGHISQLPQIFAQLSVPAAIIWRGTCERTHHGNLIWRSPDGTRMPTHRFGQTGYCTLAFRVRAAQKPDVRLSVDEMADRMAEYVQYEIQRTEEGPVLLFDGGDHLEIEPRMSSVIAKANANLKEKGVAARIEHSDLDTFCSELAKAAPKLHRELVGELRETGIDPAADDEQWLIPGVYSSRIHLKQQNAASEDELCLWAEPFSAFLAEAGHEYPAGFLRESWKWLLMNHPHDSICGCSPDQVHKDMLYRFDQSIGIAGRLTQRALKTITLEAAPKDRPDGSMVLGLFNPTAEAVDEPVDFDVPLPVAWPKKFQEFFGFEEKLAFKLRDPAGRDVPYQLVAQRRDASVFYRPRYKFPQPDHRQVCSVTARVKVPAFGYTTLVVEPVDGPTRYLGSMAKSHRTIDNGVLRLFVNANGTFDLTDLRNGQTFRQLLTFENRSDIGDGWYHGIPVNDQVFASVASPADVALVTDGAEKATLRITTRMSVPAEFDFRSMTRSSRLAELRVTSDVTLRAGSDRVEIATTVDNNVLDHRLRVLFPTDLKGDTYFSDSAFDVVERKIALPADNARRKELDVETRPQITFTAFTDGAHGLAVVSRGLPECTVRDTEDRPIALTLFRAFRRAVLANENMGGQIQGTHTFRYDLVPFAGALPAKRLLVLGQRVAGAIRTADAVPVEIDQAEVGKRPREASFLSVEGGALVTSVQRKDEHLLVRLFNPTTEPADVRVSAPGRRTATAVTLDDRPDPSVKPHATGLRLPGKRITTVLLK